MRRHHYQKYHHQNSLNSDLNNDTSVSGDLNARVAYLEELLNSYQAQSMALDSPLLFLIKKYY